MEYRTLGRTCLEVGAIGLGTEHIEQSKETVEGVVRAAVGAGVSYIDILFEDPEGARDFWDSFAPVVREHRDTLTLAAHWGPSYWGDVDKGGRCLDEILRRVGNDYVEVAMIAVIDTEEQWDDWGRRSADALLRYKEQGRIGHIGMSGHYPSTVMKAIGSGLVDVVMFGINMIKHDDEPVRDLCQACADANIGLVAMKPYYGGGLLEVSGKPTSITPTQCLAYVLSQPVSTVVPGVRNLDDLRATLHYLEATDDEKDYGSVVADLPVHLEGVCTGCRHCLPCPQNIDIGQVMMLLGFAQGGATDELREWYGGFEVKASACTECGECMERCAFNVDITGKMRQVVELFEGEAG